MFKKVCGVLGFGGGASTYWTVGRIAVVGINGIGTAFSIPAIVVGATSAVAVGTTAYVAGGIVKKGYDKFFG